MFEETKRTAREQVDQTKSTAKRQARDRAERQVETAKEELGPAVLNLVESYFPDQARERRQRIALRSFVAGGAVGVVLRHALGR